MTKDGHPSFVFGAIIRGMAEVAGYLREAVDKLSAALGDRLLGVVLYGSHARGEAREDSDVDLLVIARGLPERWYDRNVALHRAVRGIKQAPDITVLGKTPEEFERYFPSLYLDVGLDGVALYDRDGYAARKLQRIREIIRETGLVRKRLVRGSLFWDWPIKVTRPWEITWEGFHELA
jgi:predicted nucleotidyltransferase